MPPTWGLTWTSWASGNPFPYGGVGFNRHPHGGMSIVGESMHKNSEIAALPLVAAMIGKRYGIRIEVGGNRAATDGQTVYLPALPLDDDIARLLCRGYLDHEAGHLRFTQFGVRASARSSFEAHLYQLVEDYRIEARMGETYPGCRVNLSTMLQYLVEKEEIFLNPEGAREALCSYLFFTTRAWLYPALQSHQANAQAQLTAQVPAMVCLLAPILQEVRKAACTVDSLRCAAAIIDLLRDLASAGAGTGEPDGDPEGEQQSDTPGTGQPDGDPTRHGSATLLRGFCTNVLDSPDSEDEDLLGRHVRDLLESMAEEGGDPISVAEESVISTSPISSDDARRATTALRARLQGLVQAKTLAKLRPGRRGTLAGRNLHRAAIGDDRLFRRAEERTAVNTAVHILLDASGSMAEGDRMHVASLTSLALVQALSAINHVRPALTGFSDEVFPLIRYGERVHNRIGLVPMAGTQLAEALWWVMGQMVTLEERRKIVLVITDGDPTSSHIAMKNVVATAQAVGFELFGIGICQPNIATYIPASRYIQTVGELPQVMFDMLGEVLA
ncbi:von Willebrand factor type A domain protein [Desulfovibrio sp. A2]|nr:von Willebrand factor type A domain protein [Desulfovibrio sp. A2]